MITNEQYKKVAEAMTRLVMETMDREDSFSDVVKNICFMAKLKYDEDCEEDDNYLYNMSVNAYSTILNTVPGFMNYYIESIGNYKYALIHNLIFTDNEFYETQEHPTIHAIQTINSYITSNHLCDAEHRAILQDIIDTLSSIDIPVCLIGSFLGYNIYQLLDSTFFDISNDLFCVGAIQTEGALEHELGDYVFHIRYSNGGGKGYSVALTRVNGKIVARFYMYTQFYEPYRITHSDCLSEMEVACNENSLIAVANAAKVLAQNENQRNCPCE